jgi:hypothetical protein
MKKIAFALLLLLFGAGASRLIEPHIAKAQSGCTLETIKGNYAFVLNGSYLANNSFQPISAVGTVTADGNGSLSGVESISEGGVITRNYSYPGSYTVNANCTGSATTGSGSNTSHFDFVIVPSNGNVQFLETDAGTAMAAVAYKLSGPGFAPR